ncbi:MAG: hypothetical protein AAF587_41485 [Bacteroidota bacterium]
MNRIVQLFLLSLLALSLTFCNEVKEVIEPHTWTILPQEEGKYRILQVWDTTFNTAGISQPEVDIYYKKEELGGEEVDLLNRPIRLINVYRSDLDLGTNYEFQIDRVWSQFIDPQSGTDYFAERIEENDRILILKFPVSTGISWNGNLFNDRQVGTGIFEYGDTDTTVVIQGMSFDNCVMVIHSADTNNLINNRFAYEIYAPEIGLIKKYDKTIVNDGPNGEFNSSKSRIYIEEIIEHN